MPIEVDDYVNVDTQLKAFGMNMPQGIAFLPRNLATADSPSALLHESSVSTLRILFRQSGIVEDRIESPEQTILVLQENAFELTLPALFIGISLLTENAAAVNVALSVIANYATDFFKGIGGERRVKFSIVVEDRYTGKYKRFRYSGDPAGLKEFGRIVEQASNDSNS
ncbi:MAG: hypothetical protein HND58_01485 [Planctomycetota bacterium]|nr:MAG: hypothetical protein HND58_01485 [Planctomycetota bacterium]